MNWRILNIDGYEERLALYRAEMCMKFYCEMGKLLFERPNLGVYITDISASGEITEMYE